MNVLGLPLHPLVVHAVVILVPLGFAGMLAVMAVRRWRRSYGPLAVAALVLGAGAAWVAVEAGEDLAANMGVPSNHATWGKVTVYAAAAAAVLSMIWMIVDMLAARRARNEVESSQPAAHSAQAHPTHALPAPRNTTSEVVGWVSVLVAGFAVFATIQAGHSGAEAVWAEHPAPAATAEKADNDAMTEKAETPDNAGSDVSTPAQPAAPAATPSPSETAMGSGLPHYIMQDVQSHSSAESCWSAIDGKVYDLTQWAAKHPGGEKAIHKICGTDGTDIFNGKHGNSEKILKLLPKFQIGVLDN